MFDEQPGQRDSSDRSDVRPGWSTDPPPGARFAPEERKLGVWAGSPAERIEHGVNVHVHVLVAGVDRVGGVSESSAQELQPG